LLPQRNWGRLRTLLIRRLEFAGADFSRLPEGPVRWAPPPLYTNLAFHGLPLQPYLQVTTTRTLEALAAGQDRYIASAFLLPRRGWAASQTDLAVLLRLSAAEGAALFQRPLGTPREHKRHRLYNLVTFAAQIAASFPDSVIDDAEDTFLVRVGGYRFGVEAGRPAALQAGDYGRYGKPCALRLPGGLLRDLPRGPEVLAPAGPYASLYLWMGENPGAVQTPTAARLALRILWWGRHQAPSGSLLDRLRVTLKEARQILQQARRFEEYEQPLQALRELLVPELTSESQFNATFGKSAAARQHPLPTKLRDRWHGLITQLEEEFLEEPTHGADPTGVVS